MRFDSKIYIVENQIVRQPNGGKRQEYVRTKEILAFLTPYKYQITNVAGHEQVMHGFKIFTKNDVDFNDLIVEVNGKYYDVKEFVPYGKINALVVANQL